MLLGDANGGVVAANAAALELTVEERRTVAQAIRDEGAALGWRVSARGDTGWAAEQLATDARSNKPGDDVIAL